MTRSGALFQHPTAERPISAIDAGLWPTPTVHGNHNKPGSSKNAGWGLSSAVKKWATPVARDYRSPGRSRLERTGSKAGECLPQQVGGQLNPTFVEWLMGWPIGWTELKPLEMDKFREWQQQHSEF
jgi:DNA (cytosine-5)-methyltransferase 1